MADLPITSDQGATPVVINDPTTTANVANVKAASTASVVGDNSLVVALSPNSPVPTGTNKIGVTGVAQGSTTSGENGDLVQGAVTTAAPTYVTAQTSPLSLTLAGALRTDSSATTQPVSLTSTTITGTVAVTQSTSPWVDNITQWDSVALGAPSAYGTSPGAVNVIGTNSFITNTVAENLTQISGSSVATAASGIIKIGLTDGTGNSITSTSGSLNVDVTNSLTITQADATGTGALGALNAAVQVNTAGLATIGMQLAAGTLVGTIVPEVSYDGGTTWVITYFSDVGTGTLTNNIVFGSANTATTKIIVGAPGSGLTRVRVSAYTSGTANITLRASNIESTISLNEGVAGTGAPPTIVQVGGLATTAAPTYVTSTLNSLSLNTSGDLRVVSKTEDGSGNSITSTSSALDINIKSFSGVTVLAPLPVSAGQGTSPWVTEDKADTSISSSVGTASGFAMGASGLYNTTQPAPTNGQQVELQTDQAANLLTFPGIQTKTGAAWSSATTINTLQYPTGTTTIGAPLGCSAIIVQLDQTTTLTGGAVTFQGTYDGTNWITIPTAQVVTPTQPWASLTNPYSFVPSTQQPFLILLQGFQQIRLNLTTLITGTGTVTPFWTLIPHTVQPILGSVSLGTGQGKSVVMKTGTLVTTAVTADQVVLTYTVTTGKTFYMEYVEIQGAQTTPAGGTGIVLGTISFENPSGTKVISGRFIGGGAEQFGEISTSFAEPIPVSSATVIRVVVTPAATTSMTWLANFGGYEK